MQQASTVLYFQAQFVAGKLLLNDHYANTGDPRGLNTKTMYSWFRGGHALRPIGLSFTRK